MPYFLVDDDAHSHPKLIAAGDAAVGLWVRAGSYCARYLTEGHVTAQAMRALGGRRRAADKLVEVGLWVVDPGGDGWRFWQWHDHGNRTKQQVEKDRAAAAERKRRHRAKAGDNPVDRAPVEPVDNPVSATAQPPASHRPATGQPNSDQTLTTETTKTAGHGVSSRRDSHDPGQARPRQDKHLLTYLGRLAVGDARDQGRPPADQVDAWQAIAGPHVDLLREAATYLARHGGTPAADPHAAWLGWLRAARRRADAQHRPPIGCSSCHGGWLDDDDHGRPRPCPTCRPRRLHAVADAS
jgi:hypothetical protein